MFTQCLSRLFLSIFKSFKSNIKYKLFLIYIIVISIPILIFGIISYRMSSSVLEKDFIKYKERLNEQIIKNMDENIKNLTRQSMAVYANLDDILYILNTPADKLDTSYLDCSNRVASYFRSVLQSNDKLYGIALISLNGEIKHYLNRQVGTINLYTVQNEPWFKDTLSLKGFPLLLEPHYNEFVSGNAYGKKKVISISRAVINLDNDKICGIILIDQDISQLSEIITNIEMEQGEIITLFGKSGDIIYTNNQLNASVYKELLYKTRTRSPNFCKFTIDGKTMLITFKESTDFGWKVVSLLPITELQRKSQFIKNINFSLLAVLIVFTFIISILFSYLITRPLKKLMKSFRKLQEGDFGTRVEVKGEDEFAKIGRTFNTMVANIKSLIEQKYEMNILRKQAELESLQSQINPHFLFNTLNSIKAVIDKKDYRHSSIMVESLSDIFRYSLNRGRHIIKFSEELEHVKKYLYIQQCRFTDRYEVYYDIDEDVLDYNILRLTLQPIVENALYHGLSPKRGKGELKIAAKTFNDKYYIYISDNGVGIPREELIQINTLLDNNPDTHNSLTPEKLGIYNVNARVKLHFGNDYGLRIYSCPGSGTTVRITLPVNILKGDECVENISC